MYLSYLLFCRSINQIIKDNFSLLELGDIFASIGVRELQPNASEGFAIFAECHRYVLLFMKNSCHELGKNILSRKII